MDAGEINYMRRKLEDAGFIVRSHAEVSLPVRVEVEPAPNGYGELGFRVEVEHQGGIACLSRSFPFEMACDPDDSAFRDNHLPNILADELGHYLAKRIAGDISAQTKEKIKPFIPEKRLSLHEMQAFIAMALDSRYSREDVKEAFPQFYEDGLPR